jgi:hypothetical protein
MATSAWSDVNQVEPLMRQANDSGATGRHSYG